MLSIASPLRTLAIVRAPASSAALLSWLLMAACAPKPAPPQLGPLTAGVATVILDAPVGVPMGGFGRPRQAGDEGSPFANMLSSSTGLQSTPTARAVALSDGVTKLVVVSNFWDPRGWWLGAQRA